MGSGFGRHEIFIGLTAGKERWAEESARALFSTLIGTATFPDDPVVRRVESERGAKATPAAREIHAVSSSAFLRPGPETATSLGPL